MPRGPGRRAVLLGLGLGLAALGTSGCGVRFEDGAPRLPLLPIRHPVPAEPALLGLLRGTRELAELTAAARGPATSLPVRLAALHTRQALVLHDALRRAGVPDELLRPPPTATATTAPIALARAEAAAVSAASLTALAGTSTGLFPAVHALLAQRAAAATLLGGSLSWPAQPPWPSARLAAPFLQATRAAAYGFEVVAAQIDKAGVALARASLQQLRATESEQAALAGAAAPLPPLGHPLPFPVTTPAAARRLAQHLVVGLRGSLGDGLSDVAGQRAASATVVRWLAGTEVLASRWGVALQAFPGLR